MIEIIKEFLVSKNIQILEIITDSDSKLCFKCCVDDINYKRKIDEILSEFVFDDNLLYSENEDYSKCDLLNFNVLIKKIVLKQIIPERYIHHITYEGREKKILIEGLIPNKLIGILSNHPAIYFCNSNLREDLFIDYFLSYYCVLLRIDTTKCNNIFYQDCNNERRREGRFIMTYDQIPPEAIEFVQFMNLSCIEGSMDLRKYFKEKKSS